ncbi:MAG: ATP-dependent DNA helicase [Leptospirillia bacterium]
MSTSSADTGPSAVIGEGGALSRVLPGFSHRPQQIEMAEAVKAAFDEGGHLMVEAGTGTGKTFAYLVPALMSGKRVVISTGTRVLQDQIYKKDLETLGKVMPLEDRVAVLKGRSNYLCLHKFAQLSIHQMSGASAGDDMTLLAGWAEDTDTGDIAEVAELSENAPIWREVTVSAEQCLGGKCPEFDTCFITRAKRRAMKADLIVVNHHLLFADLGVKSGAFGEVIPHYDAVVFDEAHLVEEIATAFFGARVSLLRIRDLAGDVQRQGMFLGGDDGPRISGDAQRAVERCGPFFGWLSAAEAIRGDAESGRRTLRPHAIGDGFGRDGYALYDALSLLAMGLARLETRSEEMFALARRAEQLTGELLRVMESLDSPDPETVYWYEVKGANVAVGASPLHVGPLLSEHLYGRGVSVVFTSASLTTGGGMDYMRDRLGFAPPQPETAQNAGEAAQAEADMHAPVGAMAAAEAEMDAGEASPLPRAAECVVGSPFNYPEQALLYLPDHLPPPTSPDYANAVADEIAQLTEASGGRALLLFTSYRMMESVYRKVAADIPGRVLKQGDTGRAQLLAELAKDATAHGPATLFATGSFWQGVDVPGDALSLVVIDRLPFSSPDDPLLAARVQAMQKAGKNAFMDYQVPMAALTLKQGVGRLIRTVDDRGVVAVLDNRVTKKGYGKYFLNSLPPMKRTGDMGEVAGFFQSA